MHDQPLLRSIGELEVQRASAPKSKAEERARYFNTGNAFDLKLPPVPGESFIDEPRRALDPRTPTGVISCDRSQQLGCKFPATTPLYARIRAGESLETIFRASGVVVYVIAGQGSTECGDERIDWQRGDLFVLPGSSSNSCSNTCSHLSPAIRRRR
jgi:hypothetical protein